MKWLALGLIIYVFFEGAIFAISPRAGREVAKIIDATQDRDLHVIGTLVTVLALMLFGIWLFLDK
ncbi:MAG: DUF2065 family protein [Deltaproteobacteria bacterium]|nr:DUF2065 family protein [Deltaproteobacteria bacterium]